MKSVTNKYWQVQGDYAVYDHGKGIYELYLPALVGQELEGTKESLLSKYWGHQSLVDDLVDVVSRYREAA
ncbi:hypothetical protein [Adonisia turfae]|uniref:Uncharacterized protein n=1 Tax=Adonisia turfae CCMR0081 TaxID=2292702 RepID=A0A6M0RFH6_9CYAN|nr:hypothetical protein [Adonisia turfae]NEZ54968.1 hypothetical protein [Adonisia turfae CCMR0081]